MRSRRNRGAALLESVIALGVLAAGTAAVMALVTEVHRAGTKSTFHTSALDLFAAFSAQVRNAACDVSPLSLGTGPNGATTDPGIMPGAYTGVPAVPGTAITLVGDFIGPTQLLSAPPMRLTYTVTESLPRSVDAAPLLEIDVTIRELTRDAAKDALALSPWARNFRLAKVCTLRSDNGTACGTPPCGRGEYY